MVWLERLSAGSDRGNVSGGAQAGVGLLHEKAV